MRYKYELAIQWAWDIIILVPQPGIEAIPPSVEVQSPNHWITREFPENFQDNEKNFFKVLKFQLMR